MQEGVEISEDGAIECEEESPPVACGVDEHVSIFRGKSAVTDRLQIKQSV